MKRILITLLLIPAIALGALAQNKKELAATVAGLEEDVKALRTETSTLQKENRELQSTVLRLQTTILQYEQSQTALKERLAAMEEKVEDIAQNTTKGPHLDPQLLEGRTPEETAINTLLHNYMKADNPHDRFAYVIQSEKVNAVMKAYYGAKIGIGEPTLLRAEDIKIEGTDLTTYNKAIPVVADKHLYYVVRTQDGYKIDWLGSFQVNETSFEKYVKTGSRSPHTFKATAEIFDYYTNTDWEKLALSAVITNGDTSLEFAYINKSNPSWPELKRLLAANDKVNVTLQVHCENENGQTIVIVDKVVRFTTSEY